MGNCLKTQLKESVNNSNLEKFDTLIFIVKHSEQANRSIPIKAVAGTKVKSYGGTFSTTGTSGIYSDNYTFISDASYVQIYPSNPEVGSQMTLEFKSKQSIRGYNNADEIYVDVANFEYIPLTEIVLSGVNGAYGTFKTKYPEVIKFYTNTEYYNKNNITTNLASFVGAAELLEVSLNSNANATGSIVNFKDSKKMTSLNVYGCAGITGEVNDLAAAQVANERTSGTLTITARRSKATDDGNEITDAYMETKNATKIVLTFNSSVPNGYTKSYE